MAGPGRDTARVSKKKSASALVEGASWRWKERRLLF